MLYRHHNDVFNRDLNGFSSLHISFLVRCLFELGYTKEVITSVYEPAAENKKPDVSGYGRGRVVTVQLRRVSGISSEQGVDSPAANSATSVKSQEFPALSSGSPDHSLTSAALTGKSSFSISPLNMSISFICLF